MLLRSFGSSGTRVGAPQEPPQGRCSSGVRVGAPEEHPRVGAPQEPGSVLLKSRSQGRLLTGAAISNHPYVVLPLLPIYGYLPLFQTLIVLSGLRRGV